MQTNNSAIFNLLSPRQILSIRLSRRASGVLKSTSRRTKHRLVSGTLRLSPLCFTFARIRFLVNNTFRSWAACEFPLALNCCRRGGVPSSTPAHILRNFFFLSRSTRRTPIKRQRRAGTVARLTWTPHHSAWTRASSSSRCSDASVNANVHWFWTDQFISYTLVSLRWLVMHSNPNPQAPSSRSRSTLCDGAPSRFRSTRSVGPSQDRFRTSAAFLRETLSTASLPSGWGESLTNCA